MTTLRLFPLLFCLIAFGGAHAVPALRDMSSDQRVRYFERFLAARPATSPTLANGRFARAWLDTQREKYRAHDAEHILELFDLFLRRQGSFRRSEAMAWLADRLVETLNRAPGPRGADENETFRMYADPTLIFSAAPLALRFSAPIDQLLLDTGLARAADAITYRLWNNPVLKSFIADVASRVPSAPTDDVARARWFFSAYLQPPCGADLKIKTVR